MARKPIEAPATHQQYNVYERDSAGNDGEQIHDAIDYVEGYVRVKGGELLQPTDQYIDHRGNWTPMSDHHAVSMDSFGLKTKDDIFSSDAVVRRRVL